MKYSLLRHLVNAVPSLMVVALAMVLMVPASVLALHDPEGNGFARGDECGYITGISSDIYGYSDNGGVMDFSSVDDHYQACVDENGDFLGSDFGGTHAGSFVWNPQIGWVDLAWDTSAADQDVSIDRLDEYWHGYAWNDAVGWIWFDWTCPGCTQTDYDDYRVHTSSLGFLQGYAWSDVVGWIPFYSTWQEMAPYNVTPEFDLISMPSGVPLASVNTQAEAPYADGYQYYRLKMRLYDNNAGRYLNGSDVWTSDIGITPTVDSQMWLDQVRETGNAIANTYYNPDVSGCETQALLVRNGPCRKTDATSWNLNTYIFSGAPTSNMLGLDADKDGNLDGEVSFFTDREGCVGFYEDQPTDCSSYGLGAGVGDARKDEVFALRSNSRNQYIIGSISVDIAPVTSTREFWIAADPGWSNLTLGHGEYAPPAAQSTLKFKPRYFAEDFYAEFPVGSGNHDIYVQDEFVGDGATMTLHASGSMGAASSEYLNAVTGGAPTTVGYMSSFQVDEKTVGTTLERELLMDVQTPKISTVNGNKRDDITAALTYSDSFALGYGVIKCGGIYPACGGAVGNLTSEPTAEHWVCDNISTARFGSPSCYFTGYLPRADRYLDPEDALIIGAINSTIRLDETLADSDDVSVIGSRSFLEARNNIFESVSRLTLGQRPTGISTIIDQNMQPESSNILELAGGTLLYSTGNVWIEGSSSFDEKTLVVEGADVYIWGNIENTKLGLIVLEKDGVGGNVYVQYDVTELWANMFIDGSVYSFGDSVSDVDNSTGYPIWDSARDRFDFLKHQLYIYGSVASRNTLGGASDDTAGTWQLGDGTFTSSHLVGRDHDFNQLREFRLCYPLDALGNVDFAGTPEDCNEGEIRSSYLDAGGSPVNAPLIIEFSPPSSTLPVFNSSGLSQSR